MVLNIFFLFLLLVCVEAAFSEIIYTSASYLLIVTQEIGLPRLCKYTAYAADLQHSLDDTLSRELGLLCGHV